jgi:lipoprotein-releasing system permease protein
MGRILGLNGHLSVLPVEGTLHDFDAIAARIRRVPGVVSATPLVEGQVLLSNDRSSSGGIVRGMRAADLRALTEVSGHIIGGSLDGFQGNDAIAIGSALAQSMGLGIGGQLTLISPNGAATAFGTIPRVKSYKVVAIFSVGVSIYDSGTVFLPLSAAQVFFQMPDAASQIQVMVRHPESVGAVNRAIRTALAGQPVRVFDWTQSNNSFFTAIMVERNVMFLILTLIIVVAAFNVISSLIMMVKDKTRDIAVLRTIGAGRGAVMRIFLMCGASVGVIGTLAGCALGLVFTLNIDTIQNWVTQATGVNVFNPEVYYLTHLPARIDWGEVAQVVLMALVLSLLATLYPSWRAARTDPVEALRHE